MEGSPHTPLYFCIKHLSGLFTNDGFHFVSLLSCVVSDGVAGSRHRSNAELVAQGISAYVVNLPYKSNSSGHPELSSHTAAGIQLANALKFILNQ